MQTDGQKLLIYPLDFTLIMVVMHACAVGSTMCVNNLSLLFPGLWVTLVLLFPLLLADIAASTYGRDYLANCEDGRKLIDTLCSVAASTPFQKN